MNDGNSNGSDPNIQVVDAMAIAELLGKVHRASASARICCCMAAITIRSSAW
jgi:hypothetical protein